PNHQDQDRHPLPLICNASGRPKRAHARPLRACANGTAETPPPLATRPPPARLLILVTNGAPAFDTGLVLQSDYDESLARLARIRRLVADLEKECGNTAELRTKFQQLLHDLEEAKNALKLVGT